MPEWFVDEITGGALVEPAGERLRFWRGAIGEHPVVTRAIPAPFIGVSFAPFGDERGEGLLYCSGANCGKRVKEGAVSGVMLGKLLLQVSEERPPPPGGIDPAHPDGGR